MIKIHRDNRVIFWLLIGGFVLNILWCFRLELQAKDITNVEQYHSNLNQNTDKIVGLKKFYRSADNVLIVTKTGTGNIELRSYAAILRVGKGTIGEGIELGHADAGTIAVIKDKGVGIDADKIQMKATDPEGSIEMKSHDSILRIGKGRIGEGIELGHTKGGTLAINEKDGLGLIADNIIVKTDKKAGKIQLVSPNSVIRVGQGHFGDGVEMGVLEHGTVAVNKQQGIGIRDQKKINISSGGELIITADGDINIQSKNGEVKINGKKIRMNE